MENTKPEAQNQLPLFRPILITSLILIGIGLVGLLILFVFTLPTLGPRWLLFFLVTLFFSGVALPIAFYLHKRFPSKPAATSVVLVREALWFGIYADLILWLQFGRVLNFALALFIAFGLIAIEVLIRLRETSRFSPQVSDEE